MNATYPQKLPPKIYRNIIDDVSKVIPDPAAKLQFIKQAINEHQRLSRLCKSYPPLAGIALRVNLLNKAEIIWPGSKKTEKELIKNGIISAPKTKLLRLHKFRHLIACVFLLVFVGGLSPALASFFGFFNTLIGFNDLPAKLEKKPIIRKPIVYASPAGNVRKPIKFKATLQSNQQRRVAQVNKYLHDPIWLADLIPTTSKASLQNIKKSRAAQVQKYLNDQIWLVEKTPHYEIYSNGLQIVTSYSVSNIPRKYHKLLRDHQLPKEAIQLSGAIAGIVYHASESDLVPFKPEMNSSIKKRSKRLIKYLQRKKSYNYLIDRFGRIFRIVQEDHTAFHAGRSVWTDDNAIYLDLNHSFLGICFEGKDFEEAGNTAAPNNPNSNRLVPRLRPTGLSSFNEAQLRSGKELTDWLRVKYGIPQNNCVPHALVSINPDKKLIGYHLDLSRGFPFAKFSLSNKYLSPLPSIVEFGFSHDDYFSAIFKGEIWPGIYRSEEILQKRALAAGLSLSSYRRLLNAKFDQYADLQKMLQEKGG